MSWLAGAFLIAIIGAPGHEIGWAPRAFATTLPGIPLMFAAHLIGERKRARAHTLSVATVFILLLIFFFSYELWPQAYWTRLRLMYLAAHLAVALLPGLIGVDFYDFNQWALQRFIESTLHTVFIVLGISAATGLIQFSFGLYVSSDYYQMQAVAVALLYHPWFFVAGVESRIEDTRGPQEYLARQAFFARYLLTPLLLLYLVILTAYTARIIVTGTWPDGRIGWLVSVVGAYGILTMLLIHPFAKMRWAFLLGRTFYSCLIFLALLLLAAVAKRVEEHDFTTMRYFLGAGGLWFLLIGLLFFREPFDRIQRIPFTLLALTAVISWGPWGAVAWSTRQHVERVRQASDDRDSEGRLTLDARSKIEDSVDYLAQEGDLQALQALQAEPFSEVEELDTSAIWEVLRRHPKRDEVFLRFAARRSSDKHDGRPTPD